MAGRGSGAAVRPLAMALSAVLLLGGFLLYRHLFSRTVLREVVSYVTAAGTAERGFIENLPLYDDYATPEKENKLRLFLNDRHLQAAAAAGLAPIADESALKAHLSAGRLVPLEQGEGERLYFFYNLRKPYRSATPAALRGLRLITERFQRTIAALHGGLPPVKIAISSAVRPVEYQRNLAAVNANAAVTSTHATGVSFDIFYDAYFVALPAPATKEGLSAGIIGTLRGKLGFLLGDALRRQFRAVLAQTLIELQDEGALYAILESRQRCYHVTILAKD